MTILYRNVPIHESDEKLIINPMVKLHGYNTGHPLDDFILHEHGIVYKGFFKIQPNLGTVQYIHSKSRIFANAIVGPEQCQLSDCLITNALNLIRNYAIEADVLNDIAVDIHSFTSIPGGENIIDLLKKAFPRDTIAVYTGTKHFLGLCQ